MKLNKVLKNKKGTSLVTVVVLFSLVIILGVSMLSIATYNYKNSASSFNSKQAYYTAYNVMESIKDREEIADIVKAMSVGNSQTYDTQELANMGKYSVTITKTSITEAKIYVTGIFGNQKSTVSGLYAYEENDTGKFDPINFLFFMATGGDYTVDEQNKADSNGLTYLDGSIDLKGSVSGQVKNTTVTNNVVMHGATDITDLGSPNFSVGGTFINDGNLKLQADARTIEINKGVFAKGSLLPAARPSYVNYNPVQPGKYPPYKIDNGFDLSGGGELANDIKKWINTPHYKDSSHSDVFYNGVTIGYDAAFALLPDGTRIDYPGGTWVTDATITYKDGSTTNVNALTAIFKPNITFSDGTVYNVLTKTITTPNGWQIKANAIYNKLEFSQKISGKTVEYDYSTDKYLIGGTYANDGDIFLLPDGSLINVNDLSSRTYDLKSDISKDGIIQCNIKDGQTNSSIGGKDITIDTTGGDIRLFVKPDNQRTSIYLPTATNIKIKGSNKVYIYIPANCNFILADGAKIGDSTDTSEKNSLQMLIAGVQNNTIELQGKSSMKSAIYVPKNGTYKETGNSFMGVQNPLTELNYKYRGTITASSINITQGNCYQFLKPRTDFEVDTSLDVKYKYPTEMNGGHNAGVEWRFVKYEK